MLLWVFVNIRWWSMSHPTAFSAKADMWSVGVVVFVLLTATYPFLKVSSTKHTLRAPPSTNYS